MHLHKRLLPCMFLLKVQPTGHSHDANYASLGAFRLHVGIMVSVNYKAALCHMCMVCPANGMCGMQPCAR